MKKVALITGASSGIGRELTSIFADEGYDLVIVARDRTELKSTAAQIRADFNRAVHVIEMDLAKPDSGEKIARELRRKKIDVHVLVNDAGVGTYGLFHETDWKDLLEMMTVNMVSLTSLTRHLVPRMIDRGEGYVLNLGSIASFQPGPLMAVYYATKAYVLSFSEALREELKDTGVSVTCLCPPQTDTQFDERAGMAHAKAFENPNTAGNVYDIAKQGYEALMRKDDIHVPGIKPKILSSLPRFVTNIAAARMAKKQLEPTK